jgi:hypothetical protein
MIHIILHTPAFTAIAKYLFKDFIRNNNLRIGEISEDLNKIMPLTNYVLAKSEKVIKRAKIIKN